MKLPPDLSMEDYIALFKNYNPDFDRVACAGTEEEFCEAVGLALRNCLQMLEDRRKLLADAGEVERKNWVSHLDYKLKSWRQRPRSLHL